MSYINQSFFHRSSQTSPAKQTISTAYTEITGTKCEVYLRRPSSIVYYTASFYFATIYDWASGGSGDYDKPFLHLKLQKSNDNFSSNIVDISGTEHNVSGDTIENRDYYYRACSPMFLVSGFHGSSHIRLVARAYSTSNEVDLHRTGQFDGNNSNEIYFNTSLLVAEIEANS